MIGKLTGKIDGIHRNILIVDVSGVGYRVAAPAKTLQKFAKTGKRVSLFTHTYVREDRIALYGFETVEELNLFEKLMTISGIGARLALAVLSAGTTQEITKAVINSDVEFFKSISGIGKKSAQRIIIDLKSALGDEQEFDFEKIQLPAYNETVQALKHFGFTASEARKALRDVKDKRRMTTEQLLKETLRLLGK